MGYCLKTQTVPCDIFMKGTPAISTVVRVEPMLTNKLTRVECKYNFNASFNVNNKTRTPSFKYIFFLRKKGVHTLM